MCRKELLYNILPIVFIVGMMTFIILEFVLPEIRKDEQCKALFPPENSTQMYIQYEHCKDYPATYGVNP